MSLLIIEPSHVFTSLPWEILTMMREERITSARQTGSNIAIIQMYYRPEDVNHVQHAPRKGARPHYIKDTVIYIYTPEVNVQYHMLVALRKFECLVLVAVLEIK